MTETLEVEQRRSREPAEKAKDRPSGAALDLVEPPPGARMSEATKRRTRAAAEAIFARIDGDAIAAPPEDRITWLVTDLDDFLARVRGQTRVVFLVSLWVVSVIGPLFVRAFGGLGALPVPRRVEALGKMEESGLAPAVLGVKALLCTLYYEHPDAAREVGFDGVCLTATKERA